MAPEPFVATNAHILNLAGVALIDRGADPSKQLVRLHLVDGQAHAIQGEAALDLQAALEEVFPRPKPPEAAAGGTAAPGGSGATAAEAPAAADAGSGGAPAAQTGAQPAANATAAKAAPVLT